MKEKNTITSILALMLFSITLFFTANSVAADLTGREIMEKQKDLHATSDEEEMIDMILTNKKGKSKKREVARYAMKTDSGLHKYMIRFLK